MEYKKCRKKFCLAFKKKIGEKVITNKRKFEVEKAAEIWNPKKQKQTKTANQMGYKTLTVREMFSDMNDEGEWMSRLYKLH